MASFTDSVRNFYLKAFKFKGRATRAEYLWTQLYLILMLITLSCSLSTSIDVLAIFLSIIMALHLIPIISLKVRRLHDVGLSGWLLLLYFIPIARLLCIITMWISPGDKHANKYEDESYIKNLKNVETEDVEL